MTGTELIFSKMRVPDIIYIEDNLFGVILRDELLQSVEKPARYTGGELNAAVKIHRG